MPKKKSRKAEPKVKSKKLDEAHAAMSWMAGEIVDRTQLVAYWEGKTDAYKELVHKLIGLCERCGEKQ